MWDATVVDAFVRTGVRAVGRRGAASPFMGVWLGPRACGLGVDARETLWRGRVLRRRRSAAGRERDSRDGAHDPGAARYTSHTGLFHNIIATILRHFCKRVYIQANMTFRITTSHMSFHRYEGRGQVRHRRGEHRRDDVQARWPSARDAEGRTSRSDGRREGRQGEAIIVR